MLEALGLTCDEAELYQALVRSGPCWADRLPDLPGVPSVRAAVALEGLAAKGLLSRTTGDRARLIASPPDIVGEVLLLRRMQELHTARAAMGRLVDEYRRIPRPGDGRVAVEFTPDAAVAQRIDQIQRTAQDEVMIFDMPPYVTADADGTAKGNSCEMEQLAAGVRYRTVYDRLAIEQSGGLVRIGGYIAAGEEARAAHRLPLKMMIVDRAVAIVPASATAEGPNDSALIHPSPLLDALIGLFEHTWGSALPLDPTADGKDRGGPELDETELRLLTLLLSGLTDEVIARQLGVGRRTVLRRARGLMDRAGVATRMQLGWHAARHGWIGTQHRESAASWAGERPPADTARAVGGA
ncbi:TrmB family transcriptional regulator [Streptomyces beijiangensis]|uniref:Helix-turn-helix transcriptional regulator n=1 Tax=Streptomyces beijiangensis TaxID=163361 RepID=A0A939F377_9ACTN|nr:helix-turn-helix domain-containing protein [Streptomyces beijiangensis]MBO0511048.1 helix-turn-helix transcriptional regulator [Streptomyces beijiangensis]